MQISWDYAVSNIPTLPRESRQVSTNGKKALAAVCEVLASLSNSGYGLKAHTPPEQYPNMGIVKPDGAGNAAAKGDGPVAPPEGLSAIAPPDTAGVTDPTQATITAINESAKEIGYNCEVIPRQAQNSYSVRFTPAAGKNLPAYTAQFDAVAPNNAKAIVGSMSSLVIAGAQEYRKGGDPCKKIEAKLGSNKDVQISFAAQSGEKLSLIDNLDKIASSRSAQFNYESKNGDKFALKRNIDTGAMQLTEDKPATQENRGVAMGTVVNKRGTYA